MCKRLGKVSECVTSFRVDLLCKEIDIVCVTEPSLKGFAGLWKFSAARQKICFPKTAQRECAFVSIFAPLISIQQSRARRERSSNSLMRPLHPIRFWICKIVVGE